MLCIYTLSLNTIVAPTEVVSNPIVITKDNNEMKTEESFTKSDLKGHTTPNLNQIDSFIVFIELQIFSTNGTKFRSSYRQYSEQRTQHQK